MSTGTGLLISQKEAASGTDPVLDKATEDDPYDEVALDTSMQETARTAAENKRKDGSKDTVADSDPSAMGGKERENVYDEIVSVGRIPEATSMEGLGKLVCSCTCILHRHTHTHTQTHLCCLQHIMI